MDDPYRDNSAPAATLGPNKKHCFACAFVLDVRAEVCPRCGVRQPLMPQMMGQMPAQMGQMPGQMGQMPGQMLPPGAMPPPGALMVRPPYAMMRTPKDKTAAGVLALLLGSFGAHKFYLGEVGLGIVYLVFCWTFIPTLIGLIEGIIYLTMSDRDFAQRYP